MRKNVYTILELITPDESSVLPKGQKWICANKTIVKIERGTFINNDLLYQNLARKYKRDFRMDSVLNQTLMDISTIFKLYLNGKKTPEVFLKNKINKLLTTNLLVYKELGVLFNECFSFLIKKNDMDITIFKHYDLYKPFLPDEITYIFNYTLALYYYHYQFDLNHTKEIKQFDEYCLINSGNYILEKYRHLIVHNEWLQGAIHADLGFIYTLKHQYYLALDYFHKAANIHPCIIAKYLPAYYMCIISTQSSSSRFKQILNKLSKKHEDDINLLNYIFYNNKKGISKKYFSQFTKTEEKINIYFIIIFLLFNLKKKKLH